MNKNLLEKYAKLAVVMGVNIQKGQTLIVNTSVNAVEFTHEVVKAAYEAGAKEVIVNYGDDTLSKYHYQYQDHETLSKIHNWEVESKLDYLKEGAAMLKIYCDIPGLMKDVDANKVNAAMQARSQALKEVNRYTMANRVPWSIVAVPNIEWAKQVFPDKNEEEALDALWDAILKAVHVEDDNDPIVVWKQHNETLKKREDTLNELNLTSLHFKASNGTDLEVGIVKDHIWAGGNEISEKGIVFNPNMPTEEIFTMPDKFRVNGTVYASKPLDYNGKLIEGFWFTFQDGKVVDYGAEKQKDALDMLMEFDAGSRYIGEVALVPYDSPISNSSILFLNTLFDENASCHLALGRAYPMNVKGGNQMSEDELAKAGANNSNTHVDFMFGTKDMSIIGKQENGEEIVIFENGNFVI